MMYSDLGVTDWKKLPVELTPNTPEQLAAAARVVRAWNVHPEVMLDMLGLLEVPS